VHLNLADAFRATKQWTQAKAAFDKALQMEPNLAQAHFNMGLMYMSAGAEFPNLDEIQSLQAARAEFTRYRGMMGPRLSRDDPSEGYLADLNRQIERTQRRIDRDAARAAREAERGVQEE
jgi:tetratricopeptide (TPR) repeat protein